MRQFDQIIVGQGIAGSTLAWQLHWLGQRVAIVDRQFETTASKISSGLISPITGKRNAVSWRFDELWTAAQTFYRRVERETQASILDEQPMLKVCQPNGAMDHESIHRFRGRRTPLEAPLNPNLEAVELSPAAQLNAPEFLNATRRLFQQNDAYFVSDLDLPDEIEINESQLVLNSLGIEARRVVFCQGIAARGNPWFANVEFQPTKGEILTLRMPKPVTRVVHHRVWLAPTRDARYLAGATYQRDYDDTLPSAAGREEIEGGLREFVTNHFEIVDHRAAIRPTLRGRLPQVGTTKCGRFGFFNGLGSKGALRAPWVADQFAKFLVDDKQVEKEIWLTENPVTNAAAEVAPSSKRLTERAHDLVRKVLATGDTAIDATAGNGFDTVFLCKTVGEAGRIFAIDIQAEAIHRSEQRIQREDCNNVEFIRGCHGNLAQLIPDEANGTVTAIMFNLGYLPRGEKHLTTSSRTTIRAIQQGIQLLRAGGIITIIAYTGHEGGLEETESLETLLGSLSADRFECSVPREALSQGPPRLYHLRKLESN